MNNILGYNPAVSAALMRGILSAFSLYSTGTVTKQTLLRLVRVLVKRGHETENIYNESSSPIHTFSTHGRVKDPCE